MTSFVYWGLKFDLTRGMVDCGGVEWRFTGQWNADGEPLLQSMESVRVPHMERAVPLPDVFAAHGPLIYTSPRLSRIPNAAWLDQPAGLEVAA